MQKGITALSETLVEDKPRNKGGGNQNIIRTQVGLCTTGQP